jgi:multidrug efflux pump subunit AcrA (membrane-fusion protein)
MAFGKFLKKRWIIIVIILVIILVGYGVARAFIFTEKPVEYDTVKAYRGDIVQTVDVTGTVKALAEVDLSFETTGTLASTTVEVGDLVNKGDVLAELDNEDLQYEADQAKAALDLARANLNLEIAGATSQSINVSEADVAKAEASLRSAEVALAKAREDLASAEITTSDNIEAAELDVAAAANTLSIRQAEYDNVLNQSDSNISDAYEDAVPTLKDSLAAMATALSDIDDIIGVDDSSANSSFKKYLSVLDTEALPTAEDSYVVAKDAKQDAYDRVNPLTTSSDNSEIWSATTITEDALNEVYEALTDTRRVLDNSITGSDLSLTELNTKKSTIDTNLTAINTKLNGLLTQKQTIQNLETTNTASLKSAELSLTAAQDAYDQAVQNLELVENSSDTSINTYGNAVESAQATYDIQKASLDAAKAALNLKVAGPRGVDLAPLEAQVNSAEAAYSLAMNRLEKSQIVAPANGIVTKINYEVGEQVTGVSSSLVSNGSGGVITMLATDLFDVEVDIPETDIVKVAVGDPAQITLDAFGDETTFYGEVIMIEPAETLIQDVVYYRVKVKIEFTAEQAVKNGMTADVIIKTDEKSNVLIVPQRSIINKDGKKVIRILKDGEVEYREPEIGLRGDNGLTEIASGVSEGEEVVTAVRDDN